MMGAVRMLITYLRRSLILSKPCRLSARATGRCSGLVHGLQCTYDMRCGRGGRDRAHSARCTRVQKRCLHVVPAHLPFLVDTALIKILTPITICVRHSSCRFISYRDGVHPFFTTRYTTPRMETSEASSNKELKALEGQITLLTELTTRVESLRQTPAYLRPVAAATTAVAISANVSASPQTALIREGFEQIKQFADKVQSEPVQDVLKSAKESEAKDKSSLNFRHRRKNVKRQYVNLLNCTKIMNRLVPPDGRHPQILRSLIVASNPKRPHSPHMM